MTNSTLRRLHHWDGLDRDRNIKEFAIAIAAVAPELVNRDGDLLRITPTGELAGISRVDFRRIIDERIYYIRIVERDGKYVREEAPYLYEVGAHFNPTWTNPHPPSQQPEPDLVVIDALHRTQLVKFLPRVKS